MGFSTRVGAVHIRSEKQNIGLAKGISLIFIGCLLFLLSHRVAIAQLVYIPDPNLRTVLELALGKAAGADITAAEMANLEVLDAYESGIQDLTGLEFAVNLTELRLGLNEVSELSPLEDLTRLTVLDLHRNKKISDISPLKNLTNLSHLTLRGNRISDMSPLEDLKVLTFLHIGYNDIIDLSPLKNLTTLTFLNLDDNRISDVSPLKDLPNLTELHLDDNNISDMSPLKTLTTLTFLNINDNKVSELSSLANLINLTSLNLHGNGISDVSVLTSLITLRVLRLHENQISDLAPLTSLTNMRVLTLHENQISDLAPLNTLTELTKLDLHSNEISDVSPLKDLVNLTVLDLSDNHITDFSPLLGVISNLEKYDASEQSAPLMEAASLSEDVNRDGIVNVTDLVLVALNYRNSDFADVARFNIYPDVNADGSVDLSDLLVVAAEIDATAAAPALEETSGVAPQLTAGQLTQWLQLAQQLDIQEARMRKGVVVLEQLLAILILAETAPKTTALLRNYPNPFNPETWIPYQLASPAEVSISIYAEDGKLVRTLVLGQLPAGVYHSKSRAAHWDGRNSVGEAAASGIYFYMLTAGEFTATRKMLIRK